ncbi:MAG: response regulator [Spirochaetaceae bacterium]|jgi:PAS domain S-box-containing protein|nr:response regulator [Spirochaetaceae bacterium]
MEELNYLPKQFMTYLPRIQDAGCLGLFELRLPEYILDFYGRTFIKTLFGIDADTIRFEWQDYVLNYCHPEDQQRIHSERLEFFSGHGEYTSRYRVWNKTEKVWKWQEIFEFVQPEQNSKNIIIYGGARDINDQIKLADSYKQIREAEERVQIMFDSTPLACVFLDRECNYIDCNMEAVRLFGKDSKEQFLADFPFMSPEFQSDGRESKVIRTHNVFRAFTLGRSVFEWEHKKADGTIFPMEVILVRQKYRDEFVVAGYMRDLTEQKAHLAEIKNTQEELLLALDMAKESARIKSEFLANMSHEIRTPMNAILGMTNLVMHTELTERQRFYLEKTQLSAQSLLRIINDILDFSKIEAGKLEFEYAEFSLQRVISDLADMFIDKIIEKGLSFSVHMDPEAPDTLVGDSLRLNQVLVNLLNNAVKFTEVGSVKLSIEQPSGGPLSEELSGGAVLEEGETLLRFTVADTGIGLTEEQMGRLFTPFRQADSSTTRRFGGTGLGLAISRSLVEQMGGKIWCESAPEKGASFQFTARFKRGSQESPGYYTSLAHLRVLLIGDNTFCLRFLRLQLEVLRFQDIKTVLFDEGPDTVKAEGLPDSDLIVMDWQEPCTHCPEMLGMLSLRYGAPGKALPDSTSGSGMPKIVLSVPNQFSTNALCPHNVLIETIIRRPITLSTLHDTIGDLFYQNRPDKRNDTEAAFQDSRVVIRESIRGAKILLVEDNLINQLLAQELLVMEDFAVDIASNGEEAVELLKKDRYDLVLMDIQMPKMDGLTATGIIRNELKLAALPIIAMTAHAMSGDREQSLKAGMNDHITKPIDESLLYATLNKWIQGK